MEKKYESLRKKYKLPSYKELSTEFEIEEMESKKILRGIRKKALEKINTYTKFLEDLLQPDTTPSSLYECTILNSDLEKKNIFDLYKKIMIIERAGLLANLKSTEKGDAEFIKQTTNKWSKIKPELITIIELVKKTWEKDTDTKFHAEYLG